MFTNYSKSDLINAIKTSFSIAQVLTKLNLKPCGGNYRTISKYIHDFNLDISHFTGQGWRKGRIFQPKRPLDDYLSNKYPIKSHRLRIRLIKEGYKQHVCECCNNTVWNNKPIPLELHHIDGNHDNNNLSNLKLLCPNCHHQTQNFRGSKKKKQFS